MKSQFETKATLALVGKSKSGGKKCGSPIWRKTKQNTNGKSNAANWLTNQ